jgi:hypothetical protein
MQLLHISFSKAFTYPESARELAAGSGSGQKLDYLMVSQQNRQNLGAAACERPAPRNDGNNQSNGCSYVNFS